MIHGLLFPEMTQARIPLTCHVQEFITILAMFIKARKFWPHKFQMGKHLWDE